MAVFEQHGRRNGLSAEAGTLLGTDAPGLADLMAYVLWGVMTAKLPALRPLLDSHAPAIAGLTDRIAQRPEQAELRRSSDAAFGDTWCGGEIEASLRAVV
jgi:glutathione S-transferase